MAQDTEKQHEETNNYTSQNEYKNVSCVNDLWLNLRQIDDQ